MSSVNPVQSKLRSAAAANMGSARDVYHALLRDPSAPASLQASEAFLTQQLQQAGNLPCPMPMQPEALSAWVERQTVQVGDSYARYLKARQAGEPRRYFSCRAHALSFLQSVAPTKLVDGAWLYGVLQRWPDRRFHPLIRTYCEELGDGHPAHNHVALYQRLLSENGCEADANLTDEHYVQGALQLALGQNAEQFLPELIGYNLGYEQLPLHLLITAFELTELDIDPYYFTLHVTVDNAGTGHARKAVQSVLDALPVAKERGDFMLRVADGYRLNDLGLSSTAVIRSFDLEQAVVDMLERKRIFGNQIHSDFCRIGGRTVNEWLAKPGQMSGFLQVLVERGWIKRHEPPSQSRFWNMLEGPSAPMFGVFSGFEKQLLHDWIAGEGASQTAASAARGGAARPKLFRRYRRAKSEPVSADSEQVMDAIGGPDAEVHQLNQELRLLTKPQRMQRLIELMAPATHSTPMGLWATRRFVEALDY